jgi:hypothetical protein
MAASTCEQTGRARMTEVRVGLVGTGFVAELHMYAYKRVYGVDAEVVAAVSRNDQVEAFAKKHQIAQTYRDYRALLADPAIDVVDICTPPALHSQMIVDAVRAGKHVICEKPFTGYFWPSRRSGTDRQEGAQSGDVPARHGRNDRVARGDREQRQAVHVRLRLGLCAGGGEDRRNPQRHR